jgi:ketosteroid isomerase-like protein
MPEESTTPDLEELWRRLLDALNSRDFDAVMNFYAPDAVLRLRDGEIMEFREYRERSEALKAVGLEE